MKLLRITSSYLAMVIVAGSAVLTPICFAQITPQSQLNIPDERMTSDVEAARARFDWSIPKYTIDKVGGTLPDGAIGFDFTETPPRRGVSGSGVYSSIAEEISHASLCSSDEIVEATLVGASSSISSDRHMIFTRNQFAVTSIIRNNANITVGSKIFVLKKGGDVTEGNVHFRVTNLSETPYKENSAYLLILKTETSGGNQRFYTDEKTILIKNGLVFPADGEWGGIRSGATLLSTEAEINRLLQISPCK